MLFGPGGGGSGGITSYSTTQRDALTPTNGMVIFNTTTLQVERYDTTNNIWRADGDPLAINYIKNWNAETNNTNGWATYADAAGTSPVDGTGGAPSVTISTTASSPLFGNSSFTLVKGAANVQGNGWSYDFTIDSAQQAKVLNINFAYIVSSGNFTPGSPGVNSDFTVWVYDKTNAVLIQPSNISLFSNSTTIADFYKGTFQTSSNSTSYRLIIHEGSTSSSACTLLLDNVTVAPSGYLYGSPVTDWVAYTPTFTGFGTATAISFQSRRVGGSLEVKGKFTAGTTTGVASQITVGFSGVSANVTVDTSSMASTICGVAIQSGANATYFGSYVLIPSANQTFVNIGSQTSTITGQAILNGNGFNSSTILEVLFSVPIVGWSSSVQMSNDTDTRVVAASASGATTSMTTTPAAAIYPTVGVDTHGAYNSSTGVYTVQVSGVYDVSAQADPGTSLALNNGVIISIVKNSTTLFTALFQTYVTNGRTAPAVSGVVSCVAGDTIKINVSTVSTTGVLNGGFGNYLNINRLSGPSAIAATENVNTRYFASATTISGSLATVVWTTKDFDSHNAMASGLYTVPTSGKYQVNTAVATTGTFALNNTVVLEIQKNSTAVTRSKQFAGGVVTDLTAFASDIISCFAGDVLRVQVSSSATLPTIVSSNFENFISISRVGN